LRKPPSVGAVKSTVGSVLSTITFTVAEVSTLPAWSVAIARRSRGPSGSVVVSHVNSYGAPESVPTDCHVPSRTWSSTVPRPECASVAVTVTAYEPVTAPGSSTETVGLRLSTQRPVRAGELLELPARSVATTCRS
jgi:hypothetical protein